MRTAFLIDRDGWVYFEQITHTFKIMFMVVWTFGRIEHQLFGIN